MSFDPPLPRLTDYLETYARTTPKALAIGGHERVTYAQLQERVRACAASLAGRGVGPGDRVAALTTPGGAFLVTFLATCLIGGIWAGLNPRHTDAELDAAIATLDPKVLFFREAIEGRDYRPWASGRASGMAVVPLADGTTDALTPFAASKHVDEYMLSAMAGMADPREPCLIVFTSGSNGRPKGVLISQQALAGASSVQLGQWPVQPLRVLNNLPVNHIGCVGDLCCYALVGGGTNVFSERFDPADTLALCRHEQVTVLGQVPTQFIMTLSSPAFTAKAFDSVQLIFWGGAQAPAKLVEDLRKLGKPLATSYGQSETVGSITFTPPDATPEELATTVGRVVAPYELRVMTAEGDVAEAGEHGEVQVRSPFRMVGYWRNDRETASALTPDGWLRTGDIGFLTGRKLLGLVGRTSEVFKSGGYNIYPAEIERAAAGHPAVAESAVVPVPDPLYGAVGAIMVRARSGAPLAAGDLRTYLAGQLANYKIPKRIVIVEDLPRLPVGKIDKSAIREQLLKNPALGTAS